MPPGTLFNVPVPQLRSPFARAVVPVVGGIVVLAAIGGFTWAVAAFISGGGSETSERLAPSTFTIGEVEDLAQTIAAKGPLLFPELGTSIGTRSIVVDHAGQLPTEGWRVYWAYPADRDPTCIVAQVPDTASFTDCEGRTLEVDDLSPPDTGVFPVVVDRSMLVIDLRGAEAP